MKRTERTNSGAMEPFSTKIGKITETAWIKTLRVVYPYGLNVKLSDSQRCNNNKTVDMDFALLKKTLRKKVRNQVFSDHYMSDRVFTFNLNVRVIESTLRAYTLK